VRGWTRFACRRSIRRGRGSSAGAGRGGSSFVRRKKAGTLAPSVGGGAGGGSVCVSCRRGLLLINLCPREAYSPRTRERRTAEPVERRKKVFSAKSFGIVTRADVRAQAQKLRVGGREGRRAARAAFRSRA